MHLLLITFILKEAPDIALLLQNLSNITFYAPDECNTFGFFFLLLQSVLKKQSELPLVHQHSTWSTQELGPFIRLCLMDQNFLAFVEDVEKELKKLAEG